MLIAIDTQEEIEFVIKEERGSDNPTVFRLAVLDSVTMGRIEDELLRFSRKVGAAADDSASVSMPINRFAEEVVCFGLRGWSNFQNSKGEDVEYKTVSKALFGLKPRPTMDPTLLPLFRRSWLTEISDAIMGKNRLDKETEKNSDAPSSNS
jgi:hypothetical protein